MMITENVIDAGASLEEFTRKNTSSGGIVSFTGQVRERSAKGSKVVALYLQALEPLTSAGIDAAIKEARFRWALDHATVTHRIGTIKAGQTIVFVAAAAQHRRAAFEAADFLMDYLKTEAMFWKKEIGTTEANWIEPRTADYEDAKRWTRRANTEYEA